MAEPTIAVGNDNRLTSPDLVAGLISGIRAAGAHVLDVGTVPTPVLYWSEATLGTDAGVQITGSHNPPEWNGVKMSLGRSALYGDAIQEIRARILNGDMDSGAGSHEEVEVLGRYVADISQRLQLSREMTVAVDCGNGVGSVVAVELLEALGAKVTPLFCTSDGTFPNHHPDPSVSISIVTRHSASSVPTAAESRPSFGFWPTFTVSTADISTGIAIRFCCCR